MKYKQNCTYKNGCHVWLSRFVVKDNHLSPYMQPLRFALCPL